MKITESELNSLQSTLSEQQNSLWLDIHSEIHYDGEECHFWFHVDTPEDIDQIFRIFQISSHDILQKYSTTEFDICFKSVTSSEVVLWEFIDNDEVRGGPRIPNREWGDAPATSTPSDYEIFSESWRREISNSQSTNS